MASNAPPKRGNFYKRNWRGRFRGPYSRQSSSRNVEAPAVQNTCILSLESVDNESVEYSLDSFVNINSSPYAGWKLYFADEDYKKDSITDTKIKSVEDFIRRNKELFSEEDIEDRRSCIFDLKMCFADAEFIGKWQNFKVDLVNNPSNTLNCLGLAIHQILWEAAKERTLLSSSDHISLSTFEVPLIKARVINYDEVIQLKCLKTNYYGKLVSVCGTLIRVSSTKLQCSWMAFQCAICATIQCVKQPDGAFTLPSKCSARGCYKKIFIPLRSSPFTQTFDWQTIRLQELVPDDQREGGRVPRTIECELTDDLVGSCSPGDVITVTGIVKVRNSEQSSYKKGKAPCMFSLYISAVSLTNTKNMSCASGSNHQNNLEVHFTQKDYDAIREIHSESSLFKLLVNSLCPSIYGHEMVKAGLLLSLFGGAASDNLGNRGNSHILVVGDPGLGKSQMLQACSFIAPRGVFVCGNTSTSSGLTVTLSREGGGDYALEAGALVLADQGCCCIDEFDKMTSQHQALLEVMEQETVSIAKAGVICTLPARTTVLAAANPAGGHYNKGKTVSENLRMGQALLSRFDLVFILIDQPNQHIDGLLSEHVMAIHSGIHKNTDDNNLDCSFALSDALPPLSDRLKMNKSDNIDLIPSQLLRKYIAYAKKYVTNSTLSEEACNLIQSFYLQLRENHQTQDSTPVTTRQLLSLIRLTQARAKAELREEATVTDALDVIEIMRWSLLDTFSDEFGTLDFQRSQHGSGISTRSQAKRFLSALHKQSRIQSKSIFSVSEMKQIAANVMADVGDFFSFISSLNTQGFLLKKGKNLYQILSAE